MTDRPQSEIIREHPIGTGLDAFRAAFESVCKDRGISFPTPDALRKLGPQDLRGLAFSLLDTLQTLPITRLLRSNTGSGTLRIDLLRRLPALDSDDVDNFDSDQFEPLFNAVLTNKPDDKIWRQVYCAVTEATPPPRPTAFSFLQTPKSFNTNSFANSSEYRKHMDMVLKDELGAMYVDLPNFHDIFFGGVAGLKTASEAVFNKCTEGSEPLFRNGWCGWPTDANQERVLDWFVELSEKLAMFAEEYNPNRTQTPRRRLLVQPNKRILGSIAERKLDVGFVDDSKGGKDTQWNWSHVLVPGELKSNRSADIASNAWLDLGKYAREVFAAQDTQDSRRFVLGFTICGSFMRIWEFDRLGAIASKQFDINTEGLEFVSTVLAFLWMSEEELGFDPSIIKEEDKRVVQIKRNGSLERLIINKVMLRARCISGRATTCWKAHPEGDPQTLLVIKDSWQYPERNEEGELLRDATDKGVVNVARYYHHETVQVRGTDDDVRSNVRGGIDVSTAKNYRPEHSTPPTRTVIASASRKGRSTSMAGKKRSSSQTDAALPSGKRSCTTQASSDAPPNRVHRRVIVRDYGRPIYKASSRAALLAALEGCIDGYESLWRKAGLLHRDISINNLMINEDDNNPSWPSFLIDLDLAVRKERESASGAKGMTGTRAFMAIGVLLGEQHSFMHDLESFFWVLFWICVHYNGPNESRVVEEFDQWNYIRPVMLADLKKAKVDDEGDFIKSAQENFTLYYQPLIPWVNKLRREVFPNGGRWKKEDEGLYDRMKGILEKAREDPKVLRRDSFAN
ncbi:hypothetical protein NEUTE1DRAFT_84642 [Neurospora tetrasperma FGSC 2508]|uniref:non-specific serine/threonine protein kinase n=1 Tax=Neurospora tetrasperma (strain FGSC 2508 / ATCC MYA-4615 / P0657) TaxID=510951 RepID=F8MNN2_NEUT8|nr:uncharacterized protein NEUTE1DRAFT_84642 [Neurospora tetrasperma FGSC 2508]EGO57000.1 hypothetical protein NEUTE1DRAFT_84642 [Neurospora tetrasperma FGSC 2508]EGZ70097.1 hypothetical protein NEUTE2DRAFT_112580 [Neurospora tetrasperma FGSC 2509]